jgi:hypothetical protein
MSSLKKSEISRVVSCLLNALPDSISHGSDWESAWYELCDKSQEIVKDARFRGIVLLDSLKQERVDIED